MIENYYTLPLIVERYTEGSDELGNVIKTWQTHLSLFGSIDGIRGDERELANSLSINATHRLVCPVVDIQEKDRVKYNNQIYEVRWVNNPMNFNRHLEILLEVNR